MYALLFATLATNGDVTSLSAPPPVMLPAEVVRGELFYGDAYREAVKTGKPLVVFVGAEEVRKVEGCVVCRVPSLWSLTDGVVVSVPHEGRLVSGEALPADATDADIGDKVAAVRRTLDRGRRSSAAAALEPRFARFTPTIFTSPIRGAGC